MNDVPSGGARRAAKSRRAEKPSRAERARRRRGAAGPEDTGTGEIPAVPAEDTAPLDDTGDDTATGLVPAVEPAPEPVSDPLTDTGSQALTDTGSTPAVGRRAGGRRAERPGRSGRSTRETKPGRTGRSGRTGRAGRTPLPSVAGASGTLRATLVLLLIAAAAVGLTTGSGARGRPQALQVGDLLTHQTMACPTGAAANGATSTFAEGTLGLQGFGSGGNLRQGPVADSGTTKTSARGQLRTLSGTSSAAVLTATGQLAAGLFGFRVDTASRAGTLAVAACQPPRASWWFTGAGAGLDHSANLRIANVDAGPAVLDLRVLGPDGEVDTVGTRGITLAPGDERTIPLDSIAPQTDDLALGVHATRGRVLASVEDNYSPVAGGAKSEDYLRGDVDPSRVVRIAGIPTKAAQRTLLIANPDPGREAVVDIEAHGKAGRFLPAGLDTQTVPPGQILAVKLPAVVGAKAATSLELHSQIPVLGTVRSVAGNDTAVASPVPQVAEESVVPVVPGVGTELQLTAGRTKAQAQVTAYDAKGTELSKTTVDVPAQATVGWKPPKKKGMAYLDVAPLAGTLSGAAVYDGNGVSAFPLLPLRIRLVQPIVVQALR